MTIMTTDHLPSVMMAFGEGRERVNLKTREDKKK
jgi:hypothetical protein